MPWILVGHLQSITAKSDAEPAVFARCRVEVFFEQIASAGSDSLPGRLSTRTGGAGEFALGLPEKNVILASQKQLHIVVSAPSGEIIGDFWKDPKILELPLSLKVCPIAPIALASGLDRPAPITRRVTGKVIDFKGKPLPADLQVMLFARKKGADGAGSGEQDDLLFVARVVKTGYFSGEIPNQAYERARALVSGSAEPIDVLLEDGMIPSHLLLVADFPAGAAGAGEKRDSTCDGSSLPPRTPYQDDLVNASETYTTDLGVGGCLQFNVPNRAIEEFDYFQVVRTSEPDIRVVTRGASKPDPTSGSGVVGSSKLETLLAEEADASRDATQKTTIAKVKNDEASAAESRAAEAWARANAAKKGADAAQKAYDRAVVQLDVADEEGDPAGYAKKKKTVDAARNDWVAKSKKSSDATEEATAAASAAASARAAAVTASTQAKVAVEAATKASAAVKAEKARLESAGGSTPGAPRDQPQKVLGRTDLDLLHAVDWDETPTFFEATEIAHGHLLHFKQIWYADGYSLGDLLYSLPLAPGQKKLIAVVDWERREVTNRSEDTLSSEALNAAISRDRDLSDVVNGALTEASRGGSKNITSGVGVGTGGAGNGTYQGFNFGALMGVSGGVGESESGAWQDSARSLSSNSLQNLRDNTLQSASAVRGMRSSVVHAVAQGESVRATTEVVANHNHCHALTIQYFEVLRHLKVTHELADVQECLFVPFPMSEFDCAKVLRWRQPLQNYLLRPELLGGFDATRRIVTNWSEVDSPANRYADEKVTIISGELQLTILIPLPPFPELPLPKPEDPVDTATALNAATNPTTGFLGVMLAVATGGVSWAVSEATDTTLKATKAATQGARNMADELYALTPQERYDKFQHDIMPGVVAGFVNQLQLWALINGTSVQVNSADFTLVSEYQPGTPLLVSLRCTLPGQYRRADFSQMVIESVFGLPNGSRAIINSATIRYRTASFEHVLVDDRRVNDDIDLPQVVPIFDGIDLSVSKIAPGNGATIFTPIDQWEQRRPRLEDQRLSAELIDHLNTNLEFYHHAIWWSMDPNRRYLLLDGYYAPGAKGRSVASVVENRLIGIVGNSLVLPVARGNHLDPNFGPEGYGDGARGKFATLLDYYQLESPVPPARVSLPTHGVFAEAVMGSCNACEEIDDSRFWRWEESPIDEPPAIESTSTATRRTQPDSGQPTAFPSPIVNIQNAPAVPDPAGLSGVLDALGKQAFSDITGLAGTQANAVAAYNKAMDTALQYGKEASTLAQQASMNKSIDRTMSAIDKAEANGKIDASDAKQLRVTALKKMVGDSSTDDKASTQAEIDQKKAATEVIRKIPGEAVKSVEIKDGPGETTKTITTTQKGSSKTGALPQAKPDEVQIAIKVRDAWGHATDANIVCSLTDEESGAHDLLQTGVRQKIDASSAETLGWLPPQKGLTKGDFNIHIQMLSDAYTNMPPGYTDLDANTNYDFPKDTRFATFYALQAFEDVKITVEAGETLAKKVSTELGGKFDIGATIKIVELSLGLEGKHNWEDESNKSQTKRQEFTIRVPKPQMTVSQTSPKPGL